MGKMTETMKQDEIKRLLVLSITAGKIMLKNGAETYRVEELIMTLCQTRGLPNVQVFAIPTGIFLSVDYDGELYSYIDRTRVKRIDLEKIVMVNDFAREFCGGGITVEQGMVRLKEINKGKAFPKWTRYLFSGIAGGFFCLLYQGSWPAFLSAFLCSVLVTILMDVFDKSGLTFFIKNIFGGMATALLTLLLTGGAALLGFEMNVGKVMIGPLMTLVPGVAMTNAVRDIISGHLVAGGARLLEATFVAIAIALGVVIVLHFNVYFGVG